MTAAWFNAVKSKFKEKTQRLYANNINKWILPHLTEKPPENISPADWHKFFDFVRSEGSAKLAPIILIRLKSALRWAAMGGEIPNNNPILDLKTKHVGEPSTQGQRWLTFKEITLLRRQIEQSKATSTTKACLQAIFIIEARLG
ncbi:hypothetical protein [Pseudoalteromonas piscicida]|uniref:hypothetical protein n=1 Tax=Pseudoalteromonas piscicida TaxID=43662 RepID=UPI002412EDE6|nr:hypothetical protein [Pseudoalteromonas piscicida]